MQREGKADELLSRIADKAGFLCLSDLKSIESPEELFALFLALKDGTYTREEWKQAVAYIFSLADAGETYGHMEMILWNTGIWGGCIMKVMKKYFAARGQAVCFHEVTGGSGPSLQKKCHYLLFYPSGDAASETSARAFAEAEQLTVSFAALCEGYGDGMEAMRKGDCYALHIPLEEQKIIHCYEHFDFILRSKEVCYE